MAGIALILDLLRKNPNFHATQTQNSLHSFGFFSAATSIAAGTPFAYKALFGNFRTPVTHCDAGSTWSEDYVARLRSASEKIFQNDAVRYNTKQYNVELKPLLSAFELRAFGMTTLRALLTFYLPLVEARLNSEEDADDDFLQDAPEEQRVDYVALLKKSIKQIGRETTVVTTRRVLERMAVHYVSERMAWKLLKDVPKSAVRKAGRRLPTYVFFFRVSKTTFRGHFLGVAASWIVQVAIETYRFFRNTVLSKEESDEVETVEQAKLLGKKVSVTTVKCGASLVFASIGAGIGAVVFRPSAGQWIGCAVGDLAGPIIVSYCAEKFLRIDI